MGLTSGVGAVPGACPRPDRRPCRFPRAGAAGSAEAARASAVALVDGPPGRRRARPARRYLGRPRPEQLEADGAGLRPFAYIEGTGAYLYWLTGEDVRPEDWTVLANAGRGPEWEHHPAPSARFILSVLTGEIHSDILDNLPVDDHTFDPNDQILGG